MTKRQYRHASRIFRTNGWEYTFNFFQNYPERLNALLRVYAHYPEHIKSLRHMYTCNYV